MSAREAKPWSHEVRFHRHISHVEALRSNVPSHGEVVVGGHLTKRYLGVWDQHIVETSGVLRKVMGNVGLGLR